MGTAAPRRCLGPGLLGGVCGVIHYAGLIEVGRSIHRADLYWDYDVNGIQFWR